MEAFNNAFGAARKDVQQDYYSLLNCGPQHSIEMIRAEYKRLALDCHPDRFSGDPERAERFRLLTEAVEVLSDEKERVFYDQWRTSGLLVPFKIWRASFAQSPPVTHWSTREGPLRLEGHGKDEVNEREEMRRRFRDYQI